jgi:hypothetical protein
LSILTTFPRVDEDKIMPIDPAVLAWEESNSFEASIEEIRLQMEGLEETKEEETLGAEEKRPSNEGGASIVAIEVLDVQPNDSSTTRLHSLRTRPASTNTIQETLGIILARVSA